MSRDEDPYFDGAEFEPPDALHLVLDSDVMMACFAAERLQRIERMHRDALDDARREGREGPEIVERAIRLELAAAMRITEYAADELLCRAHTLVHQYPVMLESLARGRVTERHTAIFVELLAPVEPELRAEVVPAAVALAESQPTGAFRRLLRALVERVRGVTLEQRHAEALDARRVVVEPSDDGMAWLLALMPAVEAHAIFERATAISKRLATREGEDRTLDQLRSDVVADLLIDGETASHAPEASGIRAAVAVTVPALSLLGNAPADTGAGAAETGAGVTDLPSVEGVGPVPVSVAVKLCGGAEGWMRILTHPETGMVLSVGRDRYSPPASLRRLVQWRAGRCMAPGCGVPASRCHIDHSLDWQYGGHTSAANLGPLCAGHHIVKHKGGWNLRQLDGGAIEWTSPAGRRYVVQPERRVPVFTVEPPGEPPPF
jgi:hypothetical protein